MKTAPFIGSGVAIITPFNGNTTNYDALGEIIEAQIAGGTDSIIICGTTGEASTMPDAEHLAAIKYAVEKVNGRIPVIAGTGSNDTAHAVYLSQEAEKYGVDGILTVTPYYNKTSQHGLVKHFTTIAESVNVPVILYNVPSRTGMSISIEALKELAKVPNIVGIKEASGDISYAAKVAAEVPELVMYSGNDDMIVPMLSIGAKGVISVLANVMPKETHDMCKYYFDGNTQEATSLQLKLLKLINLLFVEVNPVPVKTAMGLMGYTVGNLRAPLCEMTEEHLNALKAEMKNQGLIK